jgi:hypothetical protein
MAFTDLSAEIDELFNEQQVMHERDVNYSTLFVECGDGQRRSPAGSGYRIIRTDPRKGRKRTGPQSEERLAKKRAHEQERMDQDIRTRLLAGEKPKMTGRGRPPTRWIRMATELGIDLTGVLIPGRAGAGGGCIVRGGCRVGFTPYSRRVRCQATSSAMC